MLRFHSEKSKQTPDQDTKPDQLERTASFQNKAKTNFNLNITGIKSNY